MSLSAQGSAIVALFATSLLVRVLPAFVRLRLSAAARNFVERVLPLAVFINFAVYIAWVEIHTAAAPAIAGMATVALASFFTRAGVIPITCVSTLAYALVRTFTL